MEKNIFSLYCHYYIDSTKGINSSVKIPLNNYTALTIAEVRKEAEIKLNNNSSQKNVFDVLYFSKSINSKAIDDSIKIILLFEDKDDIFCKIKLNTEKSVKKNVVTIKGNEKIKSEVKTGLDDLSYKNLSTYSFYEASKKIVKVIIPLNGAHNVSSENVISTFQEKTFDVKIHNLNGLNYRFACQRLHYSIIPESSEAKVGKDQIIIRLRKAKEDEYWSFLFKTRMAMDDS